METRTRKIASGAACAIALACSPPTAAQQQSLSMSYQLLGIKTESAPQVHTGARRCSALDWVSSIGACGRDLLAKISPRKERSAPAEAAEAAPAQQTPSPEIALTAVPSEPAVRRVEASSVAELPTLGVPESRVARAVPGRETLLGSNRSADLLLRIGSRHRFRGHDEASAETYGFTDTTYQTHIQNNGHKALGVELLLPFH